MIKYICDVCEEDNDDGMIHECEVDIKIGDMDEQNHFNIPKLHICFQCLDIFKKKAKAIGSILNFKRAPESPQKAETD